VDVPDDNEENVARTNGAVLRETVRIPKCFGHNSNTHTRTMCGGTGGSVDMIRRIETRRQRNRTWQLTKAGLSSQDGALRVSLEA
jgi:hypothetical protein